MRSTASSGTRTAGTAPLGVRAETTRRMAATSRGTGERTTGVTRPSMRDLPGREKTKRDDAGPRRGVGGGGWAEYNKQKAERSQKYPQLEIDKDPVVIKFAEAEPFAFIFRHWVAKRPYTCPGEDCPLCEAGSRAKPVVFYNVIVVNDCRLVVWEMSSDPTKQVQKQYAKLEGMDRTLDDPGYYFVVSKAKQDNGIFAYDVERVKTEDLEAETRQEPLSDEEVESALKKGLFTDSIIYTSSMDDLREAVEKITDND